jgi:hypothetical protein
MVDPTILRRRKAAIDALEKEEILDDTEQQDVS